MSTEAHIPLGTGIPTELELKTYYPPQYTFQQLKDFINSGDLGLLKRHPDLQKRYNLHMNTLRGEYGSVVNYLVNVRLGWGPTVSRPETPSSHAEPTYASALSSTLEVPTATRRLTPPPYEYFTADISESLIKILPNDWPYSVPVEVSHFLIWSRLPVIHKAIVPDKIWARVEKDGLWGFTGTDEPVPKPADEEAILVQQAGNGVHQFVLNKWKEAEWECAWFVNPPRLQSVPGLAHIHVFARRK